MTFPLDDIDIDLNHVPELQQYNDYVNSTQYFKVEEFDSLCCGDVDLRVLHLNIRSLSSNMEDLCATLSIIKYRFNVIAITESWLSDHNEPLYSIPGYRAYHSLRPAGVRGGGVSVYVYQGFKATVLQHTRVSNPHIESLFLDIYQPEAKKSFILGTVYKPPAANCNEFTNVLCNIVSGLSLRDSEVLLCGDFNIDLLKIDTHVPTAEFVYRLFSLSLSPVITKPTRVTDQSATLIDNIFVDNSLDYRAGILLSDISDHFPIFIIKRKYFSVAAGDEAIHISYRVISEQTLLHLRQILLSTDFRNITQELDNDTSFKLLSNCVYNSYNIACPIVKKRVSPKRMRKPWITDNILACIRQRTAYSVLWKTNRLPTLFYKNYRNQVTNMIRTAKQRYYLQKFNQMKDNIKGTWRLINSILCPNKTGGCRISIKKIIRDNIEYTHEGEIAEKFNNYFVGVAQQIQESVSVSNVSPMNYMRGTYRNSFFYSHVDESNVQSVIQSLKNKRCGLYCVPVKVLKAISDIISPILVILINRSFISGDFPQCLKIARITPIYKGGNHSDLGNYRPISILPVFAKIFEKLIYNQLYKYIEKLNILKKCQYGFQSKVSTTHAIINHLNYLYQKLEQNYFVLSIFLDFKKAFDCVDHDVLLSKLQYYGIRGFAHSWFKSYLTSRKQYTVVGEAQSSLKYITSGVPQGSNLGPLLFLLFINDLPNCSDLFRFTLFADDSTLTATFRKDEINITDKINNELALVNSWLVANKIAVNADKTKYIAFSCRRNIVLNLLHIGDVRIKETSHIKFLGVHLDAKLTFRQHVKYISTKLAKSLGILNKLKYYLPQDIMRTLYLTFVQPYFLYGIQCWFSTYSNNTDSAVNLQKRAIRIVTNSEYLAHTGQLFKMLGILKLKDLYRIHVLLYMFKTINSNYDSKLLALLNYQADVHNYSTRSASLFRLPNFRKSVSRFSLQYRGPALWNDLPLYMREIRSINKFKSQLRDLCFAEY